jgi:Tol biopolymer transport system component
MRLHAKFGWLWLLAGAVALLGAGVREGSAIAATAHGQLAVSKLGCKPCWAGIEQVNAASGRTAILSRRAGWLDSHPTWSPGGTRIAFSRTTNGYRSFQLYVMDSTGRHVHRITGGRFDDSPAWSPDGHWIAFQSTSGIEKVRPDGSGRHKVGGLAQASDPAWSPDGHLTFTQSGYVWTARADGSGRHRLTKGSDPAWSPHGGLIAYMLPDGGIAKIRAAGGKPHFLSLGLQPTWAPGADRIAYTRWPPTNEFSVWVMNADGTGQRLLAHDARDPAWRP